VDRLGISENDLPAARPFAISNWSAYSKNTLRGFFTVELPSGLVIHSLALHVKNGARWISMPGRKRSTQHGSTTFEPLVQFATRRAGDRFRDACLTALAAAGIEAAR
jgi:DNA-binding cell septation regulator SpoVG